MKVKVFVIGTNGIRKKYGDPIAVPLSDVSSGYENVIHRIKGAAVLYSGEKVGVEILTDRERKIIIGEEKIKDRLWWEIWEILKNS